MSTTTIEKLLSKAAIQRCTLLAHYQKFSPTLVKKIMNIHQQSLLGGLKPNTLDESLNDSEIVALLHLVIPDSEILLSPIETDPLECLSLPDLSVFEQPLISQLPAVEDPIRPELPVIEQLEQLFMPESQTIDSPFLPQPPTTVFGGASLSANDLSELFLSQSIHFETEPVFEFTQDWIDTPPLFHLGPTVPSIAVEIPPLNQLDSANELAGILFKDMETHRDTRKRNQTLLWKKTRGTCKVAGCNTKMQSKGKCIRHGGGRRCMVEGCIRGAQTMRLCKRHGGGARCKVEGCETSSQGGGLCRAHGGGKLCTAPGCKKGAQRQGKCSSHSSQKCRVNECTSVARCRGLCNKHKRQNNSSH